MKITQLKRKSSDFQQPIDEPSLQEALGSALPEELILEVNELPGGMFNNTYVVSTKGNKYILKIAPHPNAKVLFHEKFLMQREQSLFLTLQGLSPLIPEYVCFFIINDRCSFLQKHVDGDLWFDVIDTLSVSEDQRLWRQLGVFARKVHAVSGETFGYPAPCEHFESWTEFLQWNIAGLVQDCRKFKVLCPEIDTYLGHFQNFKGVINQVEVPKLLHGDLWPRNVIIDGEGDDIQIKAVIDAERAFWGDPVSDWVLLLYQVPEAFWQGYGQNLLQKSEQNHSDQIRIAIYKGMYFIVNILEAARDNQCCKEAIGWLVEVNKKLSNLSKNCP